MTNRATRYGVGKVSLGTLVALPKVLYFLGSRAQ